jgi:hypothetical protein
MVASISKKMIGLCFAKHIMFEKIAGPVIDSLGAVSFWLKIMLDIANGIFSPIKI